MTIEATRTVETAPTELVDTTAEDPGHLVCCRDPAWLGGPFKALCGVEEDGTHVWLDAQHVCADCIAEAERLRPGCTRDPANICVFDGTPCPDDLAILDVVSKRVLPE